MDRQPNSSNQQQQHKEVRKCPSAGATQQATQPHHATIPEEVEGNLDHSPVAPLARSIVAAPPPEPLASVGGLAGTPPRGRFSQLFDEEATTPASAAKKRFNYPTGPVGAGRRKSVEFSAVDFGTQQRGGNQQLQGNASERRQAYGKRAHSFRSFNLAAQPVAGILKNGGGGGSVGGVGLQHSGNRAAAWKTRSMSYNQNLGQQHGGTTGEELPAAIGRFRRSTSNSKRSWINSSVATLTSNGEGSYSYDEYDEYYDDGEELEEPFTDSEIDDETGERRVRKPCLPIVKKERPRTLSGTVPPVGYSPKWGGPTMCLQCLEFFNLPEMLETFAEHLLKEHCIVVEEMGLIVDPKRYIEFWRQQFAKKSIDSIFPKIYPREGDALHGKTDYYFEMSARVTDDYALRQRLAMRRLEEALQCQQREREETTFYLQCMFCRYLARGNRSKIIHHLYMIHHLNLGSPDNLVFVAEYVEHLKERLQRNECIYCEKTFTDRPTLMEHMRKKNHREVNPKNHYYDKFYIINYLELGKRWLDVLAEDFEDTMPTFIDSDDEEEEESWHEWKEGGDGGEVAGEVGGDEGGGAACHAVCLFCDHSGERVESLLEHMRARHDVDVMEYVTREGLDFYERMKLVNFIRKRTFNSRPPSARRMSRRSTIGSIDSSSILSASEKQSTTAATVTQVEPAPASIPSRDEWSMEESLVPMFDNDHLLWMLESYMEAAAKQHEVVDGSSERGAGTKLIESLVSESKADTVEGVEAEAWPDLSASVLNERELYRSLK